MLKLPPGTAYQAMHRDSWQQSIHGQSQVEGRNWTKLLPLRICRQRFTVLFDDVRANLDSAARACTQTETSVEKTTTLTLTYRQSTV